MSLYLSGKFVLIILVKSSLNPVDKQSVGDEIVGENITAIAETAGKIPWHQSSRTEKPYFLDKSRETAFFLCVSGGLGLRGEGGEFAGRPAAEIDNGEC